MDGLKTSRQLVSAGEAAAIFECDPRYISKLARRGKLWRIAVSDCDYLYDAAQVRSLKDENDRLRNEGRLRGRRPA